MPTGYRPIFVTGVVKRPESYPFIIGESVKAAIAAAGGVGQAIEQPLTVTVSDFVTAVERVRQLEADQVSLLVRKARLEAQRDGRDNFVMPLFVGLNARNVDFERVYSAENDTFLRLEDTYRGQLEALQKQRPRIEAEITPRSAFGTNSCHRRPPPSPAYLEVAWMSSATDEFDPIPELPGSKERARCPETRRFNLTSTTSPGESIASSVASKVTRTPSRTRLIRIVYSALSASFPAARAFTSSNRRAGPMLVSISRRRWAVSWSSVRVCRPYKRLHVAKLDVQIAHVLPKMGNLGLQIGDLALDQRFLEFVD